MNEQPRDSKIIQGLVAATFTPFNQKGELHLDVIPDIVKHLAECGLNALFINGTTGEGPSMTEDERRQAAECYTVAAKKQSLTSIIHVGHDSISVSANLAAHAAQIGADCIAAVPPSYFKPSSLDGLIDHLAIIASHAPQTPFFYYHIPRLSGATFNMLELLKKSSEAIPSLAGIKYSCSDLSTFVECTRFDNGKYNMLFGADEMLLAGLAMGADGAVGSTYNFLAPLYNKIISDFKDNKIDSAQQHQAKAAELIRIIIETAGMPGLKAAMSIAGYDCGPHRSPLKTPSSGIMDELRNRLEIAEFFYWNKP